MWKILPPEEAAEGMLREAVDVACTLQRRRDPRNLPPAVIANDESQYVDDLRADVAWALLGIDEQEFVLRHLGGEALLNALCNWDYDGWPLYDESGRMIRPVIESGF